MGDAEFFQIYRALIRSWGLSPEAAERQLGEVLRRVRAVKDPGRPSHPPRAYAAEHRKDYNSL